MASLLSQNIDIKRKFNYPLAMEKVIRQPFIKIVFFKWAVASQGGSVVNAKSEVVSTFFFEIPETSIQEDYGHKWGQALDFSNPSLNVAKNTVDGITNMIKGVAEKSIYRGLVTTVQEQIDIAQNRMGVKKINPEAMGYDGNDFRTFEFQWDLVPYSSDESKEIFNIINALKYLTLPSYNDLTVIFPNVCAFTVYTNSATELFRSRLCGVSKMTIGYGDEKQMRTFKDGYPMGVRLNLTLQELFKVDRNNWAKGWGSSE